MKMSSLIGEFVHVALTDEALDRDAEDFAERYRRAIETGDVAQLPLKNGGKPRQWRLRHLSVEESTWLLDEASAGCGPHRLSLHALALALVGVEGLTDLDGNPMRVTRVPDRKRGGFDAASFESLECALRGPGRRVSVDTIRDLGNRIIEDLSPLSG